MKWITRILALGALALSLLLVADSIRGLSHPNDELAGARIARTGR